MHNVNSVIQWSNLGVHLKIVLIRLTTREAVPSFLRWLASQCRAIKELFKLTLFYFTVGDSSTVIHAIILSEPIMFYLDFYSTAEMQRDCVTSSLLLVLKARWLYTCTNISHTNDTWYSFCLEAPCLNVLGKSWEESNYCSHQSIFANKIFFRKFSYLVYFKYILNKTLELQM